MGKRKKTVIKIIVNNDKKISIPIITPLDLTKARKDMTIKEKIALEMSKDNNDKSRISKNLQKS